MLVMNYIVIDIEASGFGLGSYPIEFAWGNSAIGISSFLINPAQLNDWTHWSDESEQVHCIPRATLLTDGINPLLAWTRISELFALYRVYSDNPPYDAGWLDAFSVLGVDTSVIQVHDTGDIIRRNLNDQGNLCSSVEEIYRQAAAVTPPTHRADADVAFLLKAIEISTGSAYP